MISLPPLFKTRTYQEPQMLEEICRKAVEQAFTVEEVTLDSEGRHKALLVTLKKDV